MTSSEHLIRFLLLYSVLGLSTGKDIDPEMQLCEDLAIDAAVTADDSIGYAFKGDFYWTMTTADGISSNTIARYINNRWKGLSGPIDAAFTIETSRGELGTVFIKVRNSYHSYSHSNHFKTS